MAPITFPASNQEEYADHGRVSVSHIKDPYLHVFIQLIQLSP